MAKNRMTHFICKELLYDYATSNLDSKRSEQVKEYLEKHEDLKKELQSIEAALVYTRNLKKITISQPYYQELLAQFQKESKTYYFKKAATASAKWGGLAAAMVLLFIFFPSEKVIDYFQRDPNKIVIAKVATTDDLSNIPTTLHEDPDEVNSFIVMQEKEKNSNIDKIADDSKKSSEENQNEMTLEEKTNLQAKLKKQEEDLKLADQEEKANPPEPVVENENTKSHKGLLYRAYMRIAEKEPVSKAILQKLKDLDAKKGGSVEIGWLKPNDNRYFHFVVSESNFEIFKTYINTIKKIEIKSYSHPRLMDEGYIRMILEVEKL